MKTILCYGDSLTFGAIPGGGRHAFADRWPSALEASLGGAARVIAEGLGGRTTVFDDWAAAADRNGERILPTLIGSHHPLDAVVVMLGTNDMKEYLCGSAIGAASGMKRLGQIVLNYPYEAGEPIPKLVIVSPPHCIATEHPELSTMFRHGMAESHLLADQYRRVAGELGCAFFDAATVAKASPVDGVHLDAANTRAIGEALAPVVKQALGI